MKKYNTIIYTNGYITKPKYYYNICDDTITCIQTTYNILIIPTVYIFKLLIYKQNNEKHK